METGLPVTARCKAAARLAPRWPRGLVAPAGGALAFAAGSRVWWRLGASSWSSASRRRRLASRRRRGRGSPVRLVEPPCAAVAAAAPFGERRRIGSHRWRIDELVSAVWTGHASMMAASADSIGRRERVCVSLGRRARCVGRWSRISAFGAGRLCRARRGARGRRLCVSNDLAARRALVQERRGTYHLSGPPPKALCARQSKLQYSASSLACFPRCSGPGRGDTATSRSSATDSRPAACGTAPESVPGCGGDRSECAGGCGGRADSTVGAAPRRARPSQCSLDSGGRGLCGVPGRAAPAFLVAGA